MWRWTNAQQLARPPLSIPDIGLFCQLRKMMKSGNIVSWVNTPPRREVDVLRRSVDLLTERLPWLSTVRERVRIEGKVIDGVVEMRIPDGTRVAIVIEAKLTLETRDAANVVEQVSALADLVADGGVVAMPMVVARYLSPPARERIREMGVGYADATGNIYLRGDQPPMFVRDVGENRDPWRGPGRPQGTLKGATAARLVRALADFEPPYSLPDVAKMSGASVGATYRMIEFMEREGLVERAPRSPIANVDWRGLIERWGEDIGLSEVERMTLYLEPRGLPELLTKLRAVKRPYVLTGSLAARYYDEIVPPRLAVIYADSVEGLVDDLRLRPSPDGNVLIGTPIDDVVFERHSVMAGLKVAAPSQIALDLLGGPGRGPTEAAMFLDWMGRNQDSWRRKDDG